MNQLNPKTGHPHSENIFNVGMLFLMGWYGLERPVVAMGRSGYTPSEINKCGTSACHMGWYGLFKSPTAIEGVTAIEETQVYTQGVRYLSKDLGFDEGACFVQGVLNWAESNPKLWGDNRGGNMCQGNSEYHSFGDNPTLESIGIHWLKVAERVKVLEDNLPN